MPVYHIKHITRYSYNSAVIDSANQLLLFPLEDLQQQVKKHTLTISHQPVVEIFTDYFGNKVGMFSIIKSHSMLQIDSSFEVTVQPSHLPETNIAADTQWQNLEMIREQFPYMDFTLIELFESQAAIGEIVNSFKQKDISPIDIAGKMSAFVYENFAYQKGITTVETKIDEIWRLKGGVCQDFAHILLIMLRMVGIPARYVSGYICAKGEELRGEGATHAWVEAYIPFHGWLGFDPTNDCIVNDRHVRLAIGRSFTDCTPVKGSYKGLAAHTLEVSVVIDNETTPVSDNAAPVFTYQVHNLTNNSNDNSYRLYMEMQQQQ